MHTTDLIHAIETHTALQIAGYTGSLRATAVRERLLQLNGMLELAQRLNGCDAALLGFLKQHRAQLVEELAAW